MSRPEVNAFCLVLYLEGQPAARLRLRVDGRRMPGPSLGSSGDLRLHPDGRCRSVALAIWLGDDLLATPLGLAVSDLHRSLEVYGQLTHVQLDRCGSIGIAISG